MEMCQRPVVRTHWGDCLLARRPPCPCKSRYRRGLFYQFVPKLAALPFGSRDYTRRVLESDYSRTGYAHTRDSSGVLVESTTNTYVS